MGASDSKIVFKRGIIRLSEERHIPADDPYWTSFWELPETPEDVFSLFAPTDIRRTRDTALENIETLILAITSRLFNLRHHPSFPDPELAPEGDALNCVRILTRILPYLYEKEELATWEEQFFWGTRRKRTRTAALANEVLFDGAQGDKQEDDSGTTEFETVKSLAEEMTETLMDMLFLTDFTIPEQASAKSKVTYAIWQSGVGCHSVVATTKEFENNRSELLRLLTTLASRSMYMSAASLTQNGVPILTQLTTSFDKQVVLSTLCSLLNTTLKYNAASWKVPYNSLVFKDGKQTLVTYSLQFLLTLLLYPVPEGARNAGQKNMYRHFLGRLHRPQDFQFIVDGITKILNQPLHEKSSYIPGTQNSSNFAPEFLMLFWEIVQCNKRFRSFIIDTDRAHDFVILALFYAPEHKNDPSKQGIVRMCAYLLQTLSVEPNFGIHLNRSFDTQNNLPSAIRINAFRGTYADFLLQSIYNLITTSQGKAAAVYPALLAVIKNISPHLERLSPITCSRLMQLLTSMSTPSFLLANESNHTLLLSLLQAIGSLIEQKHKSNPELLWALVKNKKRIEALRAFTLESGQEEIERRQRNRKDSSTTGDAIEPVSVRSSAESGRSPSSLHNRASSLQGVPEDSAFTVGDDEDDDEDSDQDPQPTPARSTTSEDPPLGSASTQVSDDAPVQIRGMSEKARGKMPAGIPSFSRQSSTASLGTYSMAAQTQSGAFEPTPQWIESWLPELPLHTILAVIQQISVVLPRDVLAKEAGSPELMHKLSRMDFVGIDASPLRVHSFEWSPMALGWYESLLWGIVFSTEMQVAKGTLGIWNGTMIKLFRVQETAPEGPTFTSPRGAVDAVGSNIVSRIGQINLRNNTAPSTPPS